jgi:hypothetical protein
VVVFGVVVLALAGFRGAEWIERCRSQPSLTATKPDEAARSGVPAPESVRA